MKTEQYSLFGDVINAGYKAVNVASVPQRSLFRYPGGKTWFVPRLREWLKSQIDRPAIFIEPFAGGGIASLTAVCENLVSSALLIELDEDVAAVWEVVTSGDGDWLADRILSFEMSYGNAVTVISDNPESLRERAFRTIVKNRCTHGGILAAGAGLLKKGESGKGVLSRWYPETLARRIKAIHLVHSKLEFKHSDGYGVLDEYKDDKDAVFFIDPPYTAGGKKAGNRLYTHSKVNHELLFQKCIGLSGDFIMTYDNCAEVQDLTVKYGLQAKPIPMKNTHHAEMTELVIGRNLDWMEGINRVLEQQAQYKGAKASEI